MGGGNGQKAATARTRKQEKEAKLKGGVSQLKVNEKAASIVCTVCRQTFVCTAKESVLREHLDSKHPKQAFGDCFPGFVAAA